MFKEKTIRRSTEAPRQIQYDLKSLQWAVETILRASATQLAILYNLADQIGKRFFTLSGDFSFEFPIGKQHKLSGIPQTHTPVDVVEILDKLEQVNQKLALREAELTQLRSIEMMISSSLDLHEVLKRILNGALDMIGAEYGQVVLTGKYATDLVRQVSFPEVLGSLSEIKFGITQSIMEDKRPKLINDVTLTDNNDGLHSHVMKSLMGVPILLETELIGVINIAGQEANIFDEQSLDLLKQLAVQAAIAINNAYQFKTEQEIQERLANAAQVVAMGDMASNMVHNINNGVGSIKADIQYLKRRQALGELNQTELVQLLDEMLESAEATLAMAEKICKPFEALPQETVDVNTCLRKVLRQKRDELSDTIVLEELCELPPILATKQLELVFDNLINNALVAMKDQVTGVLKFTIRCSPDGHWIEVLIQDSGPGLPQHLCADDIFKLGVSGRKDGLGYGLWWCDTFLKRWGGRIEVKNTRRGCQFLVRLPIAASGYY